MTNRARNFYGAINTQRDENSMQHRGLLDGGSARIYIFLMALRWLLFFARVMTSHRLTLRFIGVRQLPLRAREHIIHRIKVTTAVVM